jgi:hypothetical protein
VTLVASVKISASAPALVRSFICPSFTCIKLHSALQVWGRLPSHPPGPGDPDLDPDLDLGLLHTFFFSHKHFHNRPAYSYSGFLVRSKVWAWLISLS